MYDIKPKETEYNGIKFRSRLEARYACFFYLLGWKYAYEPDLGFKNWQPDFVIYTEHKYNIAVEVKPSHLHNEELRLKILNATDHTHHILLVHEAPHLQDIYSFVIGRLWIVNDNLEYESDLAVIKGREGCYGLSHDNLNWNDILSNTHRKDIARYQEILSIWNEAGNTVQFKTY